MFSFPTQRQESSTELDVQNVEETYIRIVFALALHLNKNTYCSNDLDVTGGASPFGQLWKYLSLDLSVMSRLLLPNGVSVHLGVLCASKKSHSKCFSY